MMMGSPKPNWLLKVKVYKLALRPDETQDRRNGSDERDIMSDER